MIRPPDRHLRTTKANRARSSAVEHLLCKEDALGSNPSGSITETQLETSPLSGTTTENESPRTDALSRESADRKGSTDAPAATGRSMTTVCTRAIQTPTEPVCANLARTRVDVYRSPLLQRATTTSTAITVRHSNWLLYWLVNGSAREPTTDVPSCEKPEGAARRQRTQDLRMGIPTAIASRNGERSELKHLSRSRNRKQQ